MSPLTCARRHSWRAQHADLFADGRLRRARTGAEMLAVVFQSECGTLGWPSLTMAQPTHHGRPRSLIESTKPKRLPDHTEAASLHFRHAKRSVNYSIFTIIN